MRCGCADSRFSQASHKTIATLRSFDVKAREGRAARGTILADKCAVAAGPLGILARNEIERLTRRMDVHVRNNVTYLLAPVDGAAIDRSST